MARFSFTSLQTITRRGKAYIYIYIYNAAHSRLKIINSMLIFQLHQKTVVTSLDTLIRILKLNHYNLRQQNAFLFAMAYLSKCPKFQVSAFLGSVQGPSDPSSLGLLDP